MNRWGRFLVLLALAGFLVSLPGCSGCREDPIARKKRLEEEEKKKKEKEEREKREKEKEKKEDFVADEPRVLPADKDIPQAFSKPGHWTVANQRMIANNFDIRAQITSTSTTMQGKPLRLEGMPQALATSRLASMPKGQPKDFELLYFTPRRHRESGSSGRRNAWLQSNVHAGSQVFTKTGTTSEMRPYEYYLLVLAGNPDDYGYLKLLHSTQPLSNTSFSSMSVSHYRVSLPKFDRAPPLPSNALAWTHMSVIVWDDLDPNRLTREQQRAMLDWLHFGGQLIISGPRSYATLRGSFLKDYLPLVEAEGKNLANDDFQRLSDHWTIAGVKERLPIIVPDQAPLLGLSMTPHPAATSPPGCEGLMLERRIGRGRVLFSGFPLDADAIKNWPSFDSFVNAVLLRRPPRRYVEDQQDFEIKLYYAPSEYRPLREDPRLNCLLRYFTRDVETLDASGNRTAPRPPQEDPFGGSRQFTTPQSPYVVEADIDNAAEQNRYEIARTVVDASDPRFGGWESAAESGVAGWNDFSGTGAAARGVLRQAAGINVPEVNFVLRVLAVYLLVLAPLNWLIFRAIGRVELAWIAAPVIAIVGAVLVIRMAQLDIGFARSQTDLAVLEVHEGYRRAHLTRYTALYTSLSTKYELRYDDATALALPFSADPDYRPLLGQQIDIVKLERGRDVALSNLQILSNTTGMAHSEQMYDLGGAFDLTATGAGYQLSNGTEITLRDAVVLRCNGQREMSVARLGLVEPGSRLTLDFRAWKADSFDGQTAELFPRPERQGDDEEDEEEEETVNLDQVLQLAVEQLKLYPEEMRLVAWSDDSLAGQKVRPAASQYQGRSVVLAHLALAPLPQPKPDENLRVDFNIRSSLGEQDLEVLPDEPSQLPPF